MIAFDKLKIGMRVEAKTLAGEWLPAKITEVWPNPSFPLKHTAWVIFDDPAWGAGKELPKYDKELRPLTSAIAEAESPG